MWLLFSAEKCTEGRHWTNKLGAIGEQPTIYSLLLEVSML